MNIPISITLLRIAAIPLLFFLYLLPFSWSNPVSAILFLFVALTDWLDGYLARSLSQSTEFGAFLDPVADKLLVSMSLLVILEKHPATFLVIPVAVIIGREITISALREWMAELGKRAGIKVSYIGKLKTVLQMTAIFLLLWYYPGASFWFKWCGPFLLWISVVITVWSMWFYLRLSKPGLTLSKEKE